MVLVCRYVAVTYTKTIYNELSIRYRLLVCPIPAFVDDDSTAVVVLASPAAARVEAGEAPGKACVAVGEGLHFNHALRHVRR